MSADEQPPVYTMHAAQKQFGRVASLVFANSATGAGRSISDLHFQFQVFARDTETPNTLHVRIFNPAPQTANQIVSEFDRVSLQAGYKAAGGPAIIFTGSVVQVTRGLQENVTRFLDIVAADGDFNYNQAVVNQPLEAGCKPQDVLRACAQAMNVPIGSVPADFSTGGTFPRGKVLFGLASYHVRRLADTQAARWSIQNGQITLISNTGYLDGERVVLTPATGLVGTPEATLDGVQARALLNPRITVGRLVQIGGNRQAGEDGFQVGNTTVRSRTAAGISRDPLSYQFATLSGDGLYRALVVEHVGDTRGQEWYTNLTCLAVDASAPAQVSVRPYGQ